MVSLREEVEVRLLGSAEVAGLREEVEVRLLGRASGLVDGGGSTELRLWWTRDRVLRV